MNTTTVVLVVVCAAVAVCGLAGAVWATLRDARLRTDRLADQVHAQALLAEQRAETLDALAQRDAAAHELAAARALQDQQRARDHAYLVATIRRAIWPLGDPLAPTTPGLAGLIEAGQRTLAASHAAAAAPERDRA